MSLNFLWGSCRSCSVGVLVLSYVCVFCYRFGTSGRNEELISESSGKHSKRGGRSEESLSVLVRIKARSSLSTSLLLRATWERGLLIRTLIPDTPSACSVNYQAKCFVIHCAALTAPASCFHTYCTVHSVQNEPLPNVECKLYLVSKW